MNLSEAILIESTHTLKSIYLMGCSLISPKSAWYSLHTKYVIIYSLHSRFLTTKYVIIEWKVEYYLKNAELLPSLLSLFGKSNAGMTSIFNAMKSTPQLYTMYDPEVISVDEIPKKDEPKMENAPFLDQFKSSSSNRSMRKYFSIFVNRIPKHRSMCRHRNNCMRINREPNSSNALSRASKCSHSIDHQQFQLLILFYSNEYRHDVLFCRQRKKYTDFYQNEIIFVRTVYYHL